MEQYYQGRSQCPVHGSTINLSADEYNAPRYGLTDEQMQRVAADLKQNPGTLMQEELYNYTRQTLLKGIDRVYGRLPHDHPQFENVHQMQENMARFAGYKTAWQTADIVAGKNIHGVDAKYNVNWLRTEYVHTVRSARAAQQWHQLQADKDLYPYLEYMPSTAAEPRGEHQKLYGVIKPVDDPFWDTWLPPNDWGCRCSVQQVRADNSTRPVPDDIKQPPATMRNNPGRTGRIITDRHPMIANVPQRMQQRIDPEYERLNRRAIRQEVMEYAKKELIGKEFLSKDNKQLSLSNLSIRKMLSQESDKINLKNKLVYDIKEIVRAMDYVKSELPKGERMSNIAQTHIYNYSFKGINVRLTVWELKGKSPFYILHSMNIQ